MAIATFVTINLYNLAAKEGPSYVAMSVMGLCRMLNFGIGVLAAIGVPREVHAGLLLPSGPLWVRQAFAIFFTTCIATGYSIAARRGYTMTSRVWQGAFMAAALAGFGLIALASLQPHAPEGQPRFVAPVARVLAAMLLPALWPGGLWSAAGHERKPDEYKPFTQRALYWLIVMDVAFILDGTLVR
ncbi:MAG: hypothetical protein FJ288_14620 [Planctomycetes bacterium]|nr:hypothetical protein [Planctomycetota bacterium]